MIFVLVSDVFLGDIIETQGNQPGWETLTKATRPSFNGTLMAARSKLVGFIFYFRALFLF
jgi:hypothetical protein